MNLSVPMRVSTVSGVTRDGGTSVVIFILGDCPYASSPADKNSKVAAPNFNASRQFMVGTPSTWKLVSKRKALLFPREYNDDLWTHELVSVAETQCSRYAISAKGRSILLKGGAPKTAE